MKCIFLCVFNQNEYVDMLFMLLESIFIYGQLDDTIDILVYTSTQFMNRIKQSHLFNDKIKFELNDTYNSIDSACKARLDLFSLGSISNYNKVLYLDTDIIIKGDLKQIFDVCKLDVLYALEEGEIDSNTNYWGKSLFGDEVDNYSDKTAFSSGMLLFNNCESIRNLFSNINTHIKQNLEQNREHSFYDQPYIVYNAFKYNLYNITVMNLFAVNNCNDIYGDKIIYHFPGGPGIHQHKIVNMTRFLFNLKESTITINIYKAKQYINEYLIPIIKKSGVKLEGNIFMTHHTIEYTDTFLTKAKNISNFVLNSNVTNVMEIGFNAGFSTLLMLISNPKLHIACFDLGEHAYVLPCYHQIKSTFGERIDLILGDSTKTLLTATGKYDLIHIDGGHATEIASSDVIQSYRMSRHGTILIMDDYDFHNLHDMWDRFIIMYDLKKLDLLTYNTPYHDAKCVNKTNTITPVLFQTNKIKPQPYVIDMIQTNLGDNWRYEFYDDDGVIKFFLDNPINDLPDIIYKYKSLSKGAHKADLFRYYYLYINGGVFMDSDAMIYKNIESITMEYNFISVNSSVHPGSIFQGIIGASPKNELIRKALVHAYCTPPEYLEMDFHYWCKELYNIIFNQNTSDYPIRLYNERKIGDSDFIDILDENNDIIFIHYWKNKVIPFTNNLTESLLPYNYTDWNHFVATEMNEFDYSILTTYESSLQLKRFGPKSDGGYVLVDGIDYDLFISCGIAGDIRFEDSFLDKYNNLKCYAFDGTISTFPPHKNEMEWVPKNIGFTNTKTTTNLNEYFRKSNNIFLKMDIEGSEFNWLDSITIEDLKRFSQIVIEIHWPFDIYRMNMLKKLNETHYIVHIHGNNYCSRDIPKHLPSGRTFDGTVTIKNVNLNEIMLPEVFEVTYINKNLGDCRPKNSHFPTSLDYPNNPHADDIRFNIPLCPVKTVF